MSGKGNCYDNAVVETFFKTIKSELIWPVAWQTRCQAENAVARYIDGFYNPIRRHSTLGYQSPVQFEMAGRGVSNKLSTKPGQVQDLYTASLAQRKPMCRWPLRGLREKPSRKVPVS